MINEWILTQLGAISNRLTAIEKCLASAAQPKAKKVAVPRGIASSSLNGSLTKGDSVKKLPELHTLRHDKSIHDQVKARIRQLSDTDIKGTDQKYNGVVLWTYLTKKELTGPMNLYWRVIPKIGLPIIS